MQSLLITFPLLLLASIVIGWAAEITAVHLSAGIALAILAWLQTAPEFAVEAVIAWHRDSHLALANLTGSLRLLLGLGWPMIFFIHWFSSAKRRKTQASPPVRNVKLPENFAIESGGLALSVIAFLVIWAKGTWTLLDGIVLVAMYAFYFWMLLKMKKAGIEAPEETEEDAGGFVHGILKKSAKTQWLWAGAFFVFGGGVLVFTAHPFLESLKTVALTFGVSEFVFIQWVAPLASEFPEKVTAFQWARHPSRVPLAIVNMLSSVICQWTLFAGLIPIIFSISAGSPQTIVFTHFQRVELLLTISQSALAIMLLADLKIELFEAVGIFVLWLVQFVVPSARENLIPLYWAWIGFEASRLAFRKHMPEAWAILIRVFRGV